MPQPPRCAAGQRLPPAVDAPSLDPQLQTLLVAPPMAPAAALPAIAGDLETILTSGTLTSTLTVTPASAPSYRAEHALVRLTRR